MQRLNVELEIPVPSDSVLIKKVEYEELKEKELLGVYWTMEDLKQRLGKGSWWIKEYVLYPERFRKILDLENGGFVYYPKRSGEHWSIHANKMAKFLDENFRKIFEERG